MTTHLNSSNPCRHYTRLSGENLFVDKSYIIPELVFHINTRTRFLCVTRPRRFGKTVNADMIASFFGRTYNQKNLFSSLTVGSDSAAMAHCGKYELLYLNMSKVAENVTDGGLYLSKLKSDLYRDLKGAYPHLVDQRQDIGTILNRIFDALGTQFVVVMDEWDYLFYRDWATEEDRTAYHSFLRGLFQDVPAIALAYVTGIMPMSVFFLSPVTDLFSQHATPADPVLSKAFGFTDEEVDSLYQRHQARCSNPYLTRQDLRAWYDGYGALDGTRLYNSLSVYFALSFGVAREYWNESGPAREVPATISWNAEAVQEDIPMLIAGENVPVELRLHGVPHGVLPSRDDVLTRMVLLGFLSYENGCVRIPNGELMLQFQD